MAAKVWLSKIKACLARLFSSEWEQYLDGASPTENDDTVLQIFAARNVSGLCDALKVNRWPMIEISRYRISLQIVRY